MDEGSVNETQQDVAPQGNENKFSQDDVQRIVKREKGEVEDRVRRELEARHLAEIAKLQSGQTQSLGGMNQNATQNLPQDMVDNLYSQFTTKWQEDMRVQQERMQLEQHETEMRRIADNYFSKLKQGKERYNDFDEIVGEFQHDAFPQLVYHVSNMDNAADIMYELNKNPEKLERIDYWLNKQPNRGLNMLNELSQSISQVRAAESEYMPANAPLSQIKPSKNVGSDNRDMTLEDYKNADWLRF